LLFVVDKDGGIKFSLVFRYWCVTR